MVSKNADRILYGGGLLHRGYMRKLLCSFYDSFYDRMIGLSQWTRIVLYIGLLDYQ